MDTLNENLERFRLLLEALKAILKAGRFAAFAYESEPSGLRVAHRGRFLKTARYVVQAANYGNYKSVQAAKESGELGDGLAGKNEIQIEEFPFLYWNPKTQKLKIRIPVNRDNGGDSFSVDGIPCTKEEFYEALSAAGWKPRPAPVAQRFQAFELSKIRLIEK